MTSADKIYVRLLETIKNEGDLITTRNSITLSHFNLPNVTFTEFPLVTLRKTAAKKAIREMEWFLSEDPVCPNTLLDWWKGQLNKNNQLVGGYSTQFRESGENSVLPFDQVKFILDGLKNSPKSRRLIISMWNPYDMANIIEYNQNSNTPTCCHSIIIQFFVRHNTLHMKTYQRSADMLLGVPHNWVQSWAMLLYFAYHSGLEVGTITWVWGDTHVYEENSHIEALYSLVNYAKNNTNDATYQISLSYTPKDLEYDGNNVPIFRAKDFTISGNIPDPVITHKIKLI